MIYFYRQVRSRLMIEVLIPRLINRRTCIIVSDLNSKSSVHEKVDVWTGSKSDEHSLIIKKLHQFRKWRDHFKLLAFVFSRLGPIFQEIELFCLDLWLFFPIILSSACYWITSVFKEIIAMKNTHSFYK